MDPKQIEEFIQQIKLRAFDDAYIDANEEKEILQQAVAKGVDLDKARAFLRQACARFDFALESEVKGVLAVVLEQFCVNDGKIDLDEFSNAVEIGRKLLNRAAPRATVNKRDIELMGHEIIQRQGYKIQSKLAKHFKKELNINV